MGVKSTEILTRESAEWWYVDMKKDAMQRKLRGEAVSMTDKELEEILEKMNDEAHGGEGFLNYIIQEEDH